MANTPLYIGWWETPDPLMLGWWEYTSSSTSPDFSGRVVDYVSMGLPLPIEIVSTDVSLSLQDESTYIDIRKGEWQVICSGSNDTLTIPSTMPINSVSVENANAVTFKCIFDNNESCKVYPLVDSNGHPTFLSPIDVEALYQNSNGKYESNIFGIDVFGYKQLTFYKNGLTGNITIIGLPY